MAKITRTWWGERFLTALENSMDSGRLARGRSYSSPTRLLRFDIKGGIISSYLKGKKNPYFGVYETPYYNATIKLKPITTAKWKAIINDLSNNAAWLSRLLLNEMPDTIERAFSAQKVNLLPAKKSDLITKCSCPDYANPCKHIAGTYYKVASMLDRDPFLLFQLRGMKKEDLQQALAASPLGQVLLDQWGNNEEQTIEIMKHRYIQPKLLPVSKTSNQSADWQHFWQSESPLPVLNITSQQTLTPAILIKKGGDYPAFWEQDGSFIEAMEGLYKAVLLKNKTVL